MKSVGICFSNCVVLKSSFSLGTCKVGEEKYRWQGSVCHDALSEYAVRPY